MIRASCSNIKNCMCGIYYLIRVGELFLAQSSNETNLRSNLRSRCLKVKYIAYHIKCQNIYKQQSSIFLKLSYMVQLTINVYKRWQRDRYL